AGSSPTLSQSVLEPGAEPRGHFDHALVAIKLNYVARAFEQRPASRARLEMLLHAGAEGGLDVIFEIVRKFAPHMFAVHGFIVHHGLVPFSKGRRLNQPCSQPAASRSRSMRRARKRRVFTEAIEMTSA